jgi:hypothetical protein
VLVTAGVADGRADELADWLADELALELADDVALELADDVALELADWLADGRADELAPAMTALLTMLAEQLTLAPPPRPEPLHWLTVTTRAEAIVPVAIQVIPTRFPPLAEPLHWVIAAPVVVAGKGVQPVVRPSPEPTHWLTVTADEPGLTPTKLLVMTALQLSVAPPPLAEPSH